MITIKQHRDPRDEDAVTKIIISKMLSGAALITEAGSGRSSSAFYVLQSLAIWFAAKKKTDSVW
jgi:ABC-type microcin C transport system duplicated ATPase subunit YejF